MAMVSKTRNMIEGLVREGSFKWLLKNQNLFDEEFEEMSKSPSAEKNWIPVLSPVANAVVRKCSKVLGVSTNQLRENFDQEASDSIKHPSNYPRNFLEYCCFRALALSTQVIGYLEDKRFRRLTFDMMIGWEFSAATNLDEDVTVGIEAFNRIAPAVPIIANVIISDSLFEVLTASTDGRLHFSVYEKYLNGLERAIRKLKNQSESSLLSALRSDRGERILEVDGTVTTQPILQHVGISTWPGRLTLTDHALYFEALRVVSYDKAKAYDLSDDLKQVVKPELTGPWGTRLFDKAVLYKSISLSEPIVMEFPELKGHTRRDYWLAIVREILYVHKFINKYQLTGVERDEALLKAILGILRVQALKELSSSTFPLCYEALLMFNVCDQVPGGDLILETLANMSTSKESERNNNTSVSGSGGMYSISALTMASNLGFVFGTNSNITNEARLLVGEIAVGEMTHLEKAVKDSRSSHKKVVLAQASVDGVKVDGIDTNLAVMKELVFPITELGKRIISLAYWENPMKSLIFCLGITYIIFKEWLSYAISLLLMLFALFMVINRCCNQGRQIDELKVVAPPPMNKMEQILAVQSAISQAEELIQEGNILLLKLRGLLLSIYPQASEKLAVALVGMALFMMFVPTKYMILMLFLEAFTMYSPMRRASTDKWVRRFREWWFSIPAAPVLIEKPVEDKKKK